MSAAKKVIIVVIVLVAAIIILSNLSNFGKTASTTADNWIKKYGVFSVNSDGSDLTLIHQSDTQLNHLHISPDGTRILFSEFTQDLNGDGTANEDDLFSAEVGVMNLDGTGYRLLTGPDNIIDAVPVWSPDGTEILFASSRGSVLENLNLDLYVMNSTGDNIQRLTLTDNMIEADPHWVENKMVFPRLVKNENVQNLWLMNSDGTGASQLTSPSFYTKSEAAFNFGDFDPKISPGGTKIAFYRHLDDNLTIGGTVIGNYDLYTIGADGAGETRLTSTPDVAEAMPTWSPDGTKLAFWYLRPTGIGLGLINADGSSKHDATINWSAAGATMPDWFPTGQKLIFSAANIRNVD
ncbi:MAG: hypothetical protein AB1476_02375 [Candidatus Hadarchaeota archaeon]